MMKFIKRFIKLIGEDRFLYHAAGDFNRRILGLKHYGYLHEEGWINSFKEDRPIDKNGNPIPWLAYPFLDFIQPKLNKSLNIFEYGGGNSTLYFSDKVSEVHTVESDLLWFNKIKMESRNNNFIYYQSVEVNVDLYISKPSTINKRFNLILIDGISRGECVLFCKDYLTDDGVIIADDTNQHDYGNAFEELKCLGFKRIDFWGLAPIVLGKKATSVFYRQDNCLGI